MTAKPKLLAETVRRALLLGFAGTAALSSAAFAQDTDKKDTTSLEAIVVTGSNIRRVESETASPVFVIDKTAIERTGKLTAGDLLQEVPSIAGAATNPQVNNGGGDGAARVSLRGLGEVRTLLLLNGRRVAYDDVNSIPLAVIERVEILKDGASAIYGSDAIGGVVNFITKKEFDGFEVSGNYGISDHGDGERRGGSFTWGAGSDKGNLMINVNYNKQDEISAAARKFSFYALTLYSGVVTIGGSSRAPNGRYVIPRSLATSHGINCPGSGSTVALTRIEGQPGTSFGDFRCFSNSTDLFNYQAVGNVDLTPQERAGLFVSGSYRVTDNVELYTQAHEMNTRSAGQIAPLPFDGRPANDNIVLSADSIYNPFGVDIIDSRLRLSRIGNRRYDFNTVYQEITQGARGNFDFADRNWAWDVNYTYGKVRQTSTNTGYLLTSALADALGPSFVDSSGVAHCGTPASPIANCTPVDFFGAPPDPNTASGAAALAALQAIAPHATNHQYQKFTNWQGTITGDLFDLPAGHVGAAVGFEYRKDSLSFRPDFLAQINTQTFTCLISSEACTSKTVGDVTTKELYGELFIPVIKDWAWAKAVNVTLGTRYSDYSSFGNTTNSKIGVEWRPIDDLLVRGTFAEVFRAPRIADLFGGTFASSDTFADPCNGYTGGNNPACVNVPTDGSYNQTDTQLSAFHGGNPDLKPEEGHVATWGVVYDPSWLPGFSTTMDIWRVHLKNTIGTIGTQNVLNVCALSSGSSPSPLCSLFSRDSNGEIIRVIDINQNVGVTDTKGIDLGFKYALDTDWGRFRASVDTTYIDEFNVKVIVDGNVLARQFLAGTYLSPSNGGLGNYSRWRGLGNLAWNWGPWEASWTTRYIHGFDVGATFPGTGTGTCADVALHLPDPACQFHRGAQTYHNAEVGYTYEPWHTKLSAGVDNIFDKKPPLLYQNNSLNANTDERTFDLIGTYYWVNLDVSF